MNDLEEMKVKKVQSRKRMIEAVGIEPQNRKQRRIQASKDRRHGKGKN